MADPATYVLVIFMALNGATSIAGYSSRESCLTAGREMTDTWTLGAAKIAQTNGKKPTPGPAWICVRGPK